MSDCTDRLPKRGFVHLHLINRWLSARTDYSPIEMEFAAMQRSAAGKENGEAGKE